jgi:Holliday junction DNA helicase RuvA
MLAYIKGSLEMRTKDSVVIDVGGLGYKVYMSETAMDRLGNIGDTVKVYTYYRVREDDISIFGFNTLEELRMFELLLGVSGIGAKTALVMLATIEPSEFAIAVISGDVTKLVGVPGIGKKSAERIILELKDKLSKEEQIGSIDSSKIKEAEANNSNVEEAMSALQVLGYTKKEIEKQFEKIEKDNLSVEELIKKGLALLARQ